MQGAFIDVGTYIETLLTEHLLAVTFEVALHTSNETPGRAYIRRRNSETSVERLSIYMSKQHLIAS
jgi:hypothetical protein